jgi:hypothetical protein
MANEGGATLEQQINSLEQWVNLIDGRIDNNQVLADVRDGIRAQFNIDQLRENINHYRRTYDRNNLLIFHGERIDVDHTDAEMNAMETARNELISLESLIVLFNHSIVDVIDNSLRQNILPQNIQNIGGRRVCKRGRENRSRSSSARKLSSRYRRRRSSKKRATHRKQKRRQRRASRRAY